jgi:hypothetical protein
VSSFRLKLLPISPPPLRPRLCVPTRMVAGGVGDQELWPRKSYNIPQKQVRLEAK